MTRGQTHPMFPGQVFDGYRWITEAEFQAAVERARQLKETK